MTLAYIVNNLLFVIPCILLLFLVFKDQLKTPVLPLILAGISLFLAASFWGAYVYLALGSPIQRFVLSMISTFIGVFIFSGVCRYSFMQSFFIIAVVKSYSENIRFLASHIYFLITHRLPEHAILQISCITTLLTILTFPFIWLFYKKLMRPALDYTVSLSVWKFIWIIPVCNNAIFTLIITTDVSHYTHYPENEFSLIPPLWLMLTFSTYIILLEMVIDVSQNAQLQENLHLSETQIAAQQKQMELLQHNIQETSQFRHDMRHHFLAIEGFINDLDTEGLRAYIRQSMLLFPAQSVRFYCDSVAVNALLCYYDEKAETEGIPLSLDISLNYTPPLSDTELCIILGNLVENAIEACQRMKSQERFITVKLSMASSSILVIQVINSYEGIIRQASDGTFLSSKVRDRKGIGLASVLSTTDKYNGIARIEYPEHIFKVSLLLNVKGEPSPNQKTESVF